MGPKIWFFPPDWTFFCAFVGKRMVMHAPFVWWDITRNGFDACTKGAFIIYINCSNEKVVSVAVIRGERNHMTYIHFYSFLRNYRVILPFSTAFRLTRLLRQYFLANAPSTWSLLTHGHRAWSFNFSKILENLHTSCLPSAISDQHSVLKFGHLYLPALQLRSECSPPEFELRLKQTFRIFLLEEMVIKIADHTWNVPGFYACIGHNVFTEATTLFKPCKEVYFYAIDTNAQALLQSAANKPLQIGELLTCGLALHHKITLLIFGWLCGLTAYDDIRAFYDHRLLQEVSRDALGEEFKGYVIKIMGGCDKQGFPMKQGVLTTGRPCLLLQRGTTCFRGHGRRTGERRKSVCACIVSRDLSVLNLVIVKKGESKLPGLTDTDKPRLRGPKRASKICKLFNVSKEDDVRKYMNTYRWTFTNKAGRF
ncbi:hypothetical protein RHSIM_Rhsim06G0089700 [Rhododendron simsii]|uniref:Ribosomal protein S6 n=1 Tax=Rhododendron simsii TaxID=118357 RepID=A0A834LMP7_RHOSS|nr:hypothetical protein RHSIM_Rhsim06G0089700 [Rhododendron simsii]